MKKGFTLIELIIVVGLMVVAALTALVNLSGAKYGRDLANTTREVAAVIRDTQNNAITQKDGKRWGIRFTNSVSGAHKYEVFSSSSYATSVVERLFSLSRGIKFSEPSAGLYFDQVFEAVTGKPSASKYISLVNNRRDGLVGDIFLHQSGRLTTKIESGLVGYWHFDEATSTTVYDASGFGNSGTLYSSSTICANPPTSGCPAWQAATNCKVGQCVSFNGTNNYVSIGNNISYSSNAFTVSAWVKPNNISTCRQSIVSSKEAQSSGFVLAQPEGICNKIRIWANISGAWQSVDTASTITTGTWYHVAGTYDGTTLAVYLNGTPTSATYSGTLSNASGPTTIGAQNSNNMYFFNGLIDEVRIYNRALSAEEIKAIYNATK